MKQKVYIETSIVGYLSSRMSRDIVQASNQTLTEEWWHIHRRKFQLYTSQLVINEARSGDLEAANRRLVYLEDLLVLAYDDDCEKIAKHFLQPIGPIHPSAEADAMHIAMSTNYGVDFLLTWNCKHIANAAIEIQLQKIAQKLGYRLPMLCTPQELMGD